MAAGMSSVRLTWQFHLVTACVMPTKLVSQQRGADLSGDEHQRRGVHQRVGQPRHGVRGAGTRGHQTDPDAAADAGIALCGVHGALLVAHEDVAQAVAVVVKRVVDGDDRASGIAENGFDALLEK